MITALVSIDGGVARAVDELAGEGFSDVKLVAGAARVPQKDYRGGQISMQLMSEVKSIRAGQSFTVGLWIQHAPGWHTYWSNPGVVGVATTFVWDLPQGFTAGPVQWPAPQRTKMATLTAYGYEGDCVLLIDIQAPESLPVENASITLKAKLGWMACANTCHPGWSDFELTLPVAEAKTGVTWNEEAHQLFEMERGRFPEPIEGWKYAAARVTEGGVADAEGSWMELTVSPEQGTESDLSLSEWGDVYFFSIDDQVDSDTSQVVRANSDGSLTLRMKRSQYSPEDPDTLSGVLYRKAGWGADAHPWMWVESAW